MPIENPSIREYLLKKREERAALENEVKEDASGPNISAALAAIGAGFQGKDSLSAGQSVLERQEKARKAKLADFDTGTDRFIKDQEASFAADKMDREKQMLAAEDDINSEESKMATGLAERMGYKGGPVTATKFKTFSPALQKMYEIEQKKLDRAEAREERRFQHGIKLDEKMTQLQTPFGLANTADDAKQLKSAFEMKKGFDNKLQQVIALREKHNGGALLNRDDVGRAQQLSKDLLLEYKELAKLGVLSQADEAILNAIIPADPLQYNSPLAAIQGQDPTLHKLKSFQTDSDADFKTRVATRTRDGVKTAANEPPPKKTPQQLAQEELARRKARKTQTAGM